LCTALIGRISSGANHNISCALGLGIMLLIISKANISKRLAANHHILAPYFNFGILTPVKPLVDM